MGVTEPSTGTDTAKMKATAVKKSGKSGDRYGVNGQKVGVSRVQHSDWMILLARTTPLAELKKQSEGMSIFMVDLRAAERSGMTLRPIPNRVNHETNELFFENRQIPAENLIGEEGKGFNCILDGLNAERTLIAAECIGEGHEFIDRVSQSVGERIVFGRPIGQNPSVQFPIAKSHIEVEAANACSRFHAGFGCADKYDVERKFRETRLCQVAPISTNPILSQVAEHVLGMPRSV